MCRSWHVLERKDFDVVNQHRGGDIDCSSLKTCSKFCKLALLIKAWLWIRRCVLNHRKNKSHGSMYRVRRALDQPEVDVENQHNGGYFNCSQRITCSKF